MSNHRNLNAEFRAEVSCCYDHCDETFEGPFAELRCEQHEVSAHEMPWNEVDGWPRPPEER